MIDKDELLTELKRIMPEARWRECTPGMADNFIWLDAHLDPAAKLSDVGSRVMLTFNPSAHDALLEMPLVGRERISTRGGVENMAGTVRHVIMWGCANWLAMTAKRAREALGGYVVDNDPPNPFQSKP